jgi:L-lactate dehydrogenase complex protein LldF
MTHITTEDYKTKAGQAAQNATLQAALSGLQARLGKGTALAYQELPEGPELRYKAHDIRMHAVNNLDVLLKQLAEKIRSQGGHVFFAEDGKSAVDYCLDIARKHHVRLVVKGKSMVTEEIRLNHALIKDGIDVFETDLGEYIIQLAGENPSHILAPAIHKTRKDIGKLFSEKLNIPYTDDPPSLTKAARIALREKFLSADMGISGCNLACAETGHITTVSNEGNIRMASTLPKIHMVFMGMERIVDSLKDFNILLRMLCRGASAQKMATYVSQISGPALADHLDGPQEFHLVILDNGRSRILADRNFREMLCCVRCGACLNVCPVYGKIGGHAYGHVYSGPVGAVVTPLLVGINRAKHLCQGETLCGACQDICPVNIDLPRMLLELRWKLANGDADWQVQKENHLEKAAYQAWSLMIQNRRLYDISLEIIRLFQKTLPKKDNAIAWMPPPLSGWTSSRHMKPIAETSFSKRWKQLESDVK